MSLFRKAFSPDEQKVIKIIGRKHMTIAQIADEFYSDKSKAEYPEFQNYLAAVVRRVTRKCERFDMTWTLEGVGLGRGGRTVWRVKRGKHRQGS